MKEPRMSPRFAFYICLLPSLISACANSKNKESECSGHSLNKIETSPLEFVGKIFCGEVLIRNSEGILRIVHSEDEQPSDDLALIILTRPARRIDVTGSSPKRFFIRARIEPQLDCFRALDPQTAPGNGETCVPYLRPIFFRLISSEAK